MTPTLSELDTIENASTHGNRSVGSRSSPTSPYSDVSGTTVASSAAPPKRFPGDLSQDRLRQLNESDETLDRGWPLLAKLLAKEPEFEAFPRFHEENIKNLLYYQIEIECLSHKLREQEREDSTEVGVEREFAKCPDKMIGIVSRKRSPGCEQWELVQKLRKCLYDYNAALLQYAEMSKLPEPNSRNMSAFVKWLMSPSGGNFPIGGRGSQVWGPLDTIHHDPSLKELFQRLLRGIVSILTFWRWKTTRTRQDLVAPRQGRKVDALTRWVVYDAFPWCDEVWKHLNRKKRKDRRSISGAKDEEKSADNARVGYLEGGKQERPPETEEEQKRRTKAIAPFSEKAVNRVTSAVATIAACMLPTGGIALLTTVETTMQKLLYIGGFTLLFSLGLMLLTSEISRVQIFTATAAFSAVLVVFVQT